MPLLAKCNAGKAGLLHNSGPAMGGLHILNHEPTGEQAETTRAGRPLLPVPRVPGGAAQAPGLQAPARLRPPAATWESAASNN